MSKFVFWLFRYIAPEQLPVKYGGLSKDGEFGITDAVTEITVRPAAKHIVEFPVTEVNSVVVLFCFFYLSVFIESPRNIVLEHVIFLPRIPVFFTFMFLSFPLLFVSSIILY